MQTETIEQPQTSRLHIIKATEAILVEHPVVLIFGQPGICKTSLAYSAKDPLLLDFDNGAHRATNRRDTVSIGNWGDVAGLMEASDILARYSTIVPDTVGRCLDMMTADIAATDPKKAPGGNLSQQGWGVLKNRFRNWTAQLRTLGKDMLLIAHDKEERDGDQRIVRPDIAGGSLSEVLKIADFIGYVYMSGKERILDFNPTDRWVGKNPAGWKPFKLPRADKATTFLAQLFDQGREALGKISESSSSVALQVDDWRVHIATFNTAEDCNRAIPEIKGLSTIMQAQVAKILMDHAALMGIPFNKFTKVFVQQEMAETFI